MPVNGPPFVIRSWLYFADPASLPHLWGNKEDISAYIRHPGNDGGQPITYTYGRLNEGNQVDASTLSMTLDNRDGRFSSKNVLGAYYGRLKRGNPIIVGTRCAADTFTRSNAASLGVSSSGQTYTQGPPWGISSNRGFGFLTGPNLFSDMTVDSSAAADYECVFTASVDAVTTGAPWVVAGMQKVDSSNFLLFKVEFQPGGTVAVGIARTSATYGNLTVVATVATAYTYTANQKFKISFARSGQNVRLKVWPEASAEPSTWQAVGVESSLPPADLGIYIWRLVGNTNVGTITSYIDDLDFTAIEYFGTVAQIPSRWNKHGGNSWAPIQAAGILRRLSQGNPPINSPLTRQLPAYSPTGYWPLEDSAESTRFASALSNGIPASFTNMSPASDSTLAGSDTAPVMNAAGGAVRGTTNKRHSANGSSGMFLTKSQALPTPKTVLAIIYATGRAARFIISVSSTVMYVDVEEPDGTNISSSSATISPIDALQWTAWQLETEISGANTNWTLITHQVGQTSYYFINGSYASTVVSQFHTIVVGNGDHNGMAVSQLWLGPNTLPFVTNSFSLVSDGYRGEMASDRIARICLEEGIPVAIESGSSITLGPQSQNNVIDALRSAEKSDYGVLYERGTGLGFRPHSARYSPITLMSLSRLAGEIDDPPEPTDDDQGIRNSWRVDREQGSFAVSKDDTHIAAEGYYPDQETINVFTDEQLPDAASWRVYIGTRPDLRWSNLSFNFARSPQLVASWRKRGFSPRIVATMGLSQMVGADPDVLMEGYTANLWPTGWTVKANCSPAKPWDIGVLDGNDVRLDAETSVLDTAITTTTATSIQVTNGGFPTSTWVPASLFPADMGFNIVIDGEVMTVTNVSDIFSTTKQTLTVTRNVNGGAKLHDAGASVRLATPTYIAL